MPIVCHFLDDLSHVDQHETHARMAPGVVLSTRGITPTGVAYLAAERRLVTPTIEAGITLESSQDQGKRGSVWFPT